MNGQSVRKRRSSSGVQPTFTFISVEVLKNQLLGSGQYGTIYKAKCDGLPCAAKIFHPSCFQPAPATSNGYSHHQLATTLQTDNQGVSSCAMKAFERDYQFLSALRHPNIVLYFGFRNVPDIDQPVLLMELMEDSLTHYLSSSTCPLPRGIQVNFCHDISQALSYLHLNHIIHGALSSNNVLLLGNIRAKLIDFGMVPWLWKSAQAPHNLAYMPPEFDTINSSQLPPSVDSFSFGVLVIQIVTRKIPKPDKKHRQLQGRQNLDSQVPEIQRRRNHVEDIYPQHPLLPMALACLSDEAKARPLASELVSKIEEVRNDSSLSRSRCSSPDYIPSREDGGNDHTIEVPDISVGALRGQLINSPEKKKQQEPQPLKLIFEDREFEEGKQFVTERRKEVFSPVDHLEDYAHKKFNESEDQVVATSYARLKKQFSSKFFDTRKLLQPTKRQHTEKQVTVFVYRKSIEALVQPSPDQHSAKVSVNDQMWQNISKFSSGGHFRLLQQAFDIPFRDHEVILDGVKSKMTHWAENFNCKIQVRVIEVQGFLPLKQGHESKVYVTVTVGATKVSTAKLPTSSTVQQPGAEHKKTLTWDEDFALMCYDYFEVIRVKLWRESAIGRIRRVPDSVLVGEVDIKVRNLGASKEVWYKLANRTSKSSEKPVRRIKLFLSATVNGDAERPPLSTIEHYKKLHKHLFHHCHLETEEPLIILPNNLQPQILVDLNEEAFCPLLPPVAQEITDMCAKKYAVAPITRLMTHFELLVNNHSLANAFTMIETFFKILKQQIHLATESARTRVSVEMYMQQCGFSYEHFRSVLKKLLSFLETDLQHYREVCQIDDQEKLENLVSTCQLMETVLDFQQQVMNVMYPATLQCRITENMKVGVRKLFAFVVDQATPEGHPDDVHPARDTSTGEPFDFFVYLIHQLTKIIQEDRAVYAPKVAKFCGSVDFGDISAKELWRLFYDNLESFFSEETNLDLFSPDEYIKLFFCVKNFYNSHMRSVASLATVIPKFPRLFVPCVKQRLKQAHELGVSYIDNAWKDDEAKNAFSSYEGLKFTTSVFDTLCYVNGELNLITDLELEDNLLRMDQYEDFTKVIRTMVQHYVDKVTTHITQRIGDLKTACMLLNNLQKLRTGVQDLFTQMGGKEGAGPGATEMLDGVQNFVLSDNLSTLCSSVGKSLTPSVEKGVRGVQTELIKLKGKESLKTRTAATAVAKPLMDILTEKARIIHSTCECTIAQKVMKELWYICLENLRLMLLPMMSSVKLKQDTGGQSVLVTRCVDFPAHNFSSKQCSTFKEFVSSILKKGFQQCEVNGGKLKDPIERGVKQLMDAVSLYEKPTELLIMEFIREETSCLQSTDAPCGELYIKLSTSTQTFTGDVRGTIRVLAAANLKEGESTTGTALKPYIELTLINPFTLSKKKNKFTTNSKTGDSPQYNESFKFTLSHWERSELQVVAKTRPSLAFFGKDRTIGVAVVPLASITKTPSMTLGLSNSLSLSDRCQAIVNVLCVRRDLSNDITAREFLELKNYLL